MVLGVGVRRRWWMGEPDRQTRKRNIPLCPEGSEIHVLATLDLLSQRHHIIKQHALNRNIARKNLIATAKSGRAPKQQIPMPLCHRTEATSWTLFTCWIFDSIVHNACGVCHEMASRLRLSHAGQLAADRWNRVSIHIRQ